MFSFKFKSYAIFGPIKTLKATSTSSMYLAIGPGDSIVGSSLEGRHFIGTRFGVLLKPNKPFAFDGILIEPSVSVP